MRRRTLLTWATVGGLSACASGPKLTVQNVDLRKIALLDIKEWEHTGDSGPFDRKLVKVPQSQPYYAPVSPTALGMAIGSALRGSRDSASYKARSDITLALAPVGLSPKKALVAALGTSLAQRSLPVTTIADPYESENVRNNWKFGGLGDSYDAVVDIQINEAGYFFSKEAGGFSPMLYVYVQLISTAGKGVRLESYSYNADYSETGKEARSYATPRTITVANLGQMTELAPVIRQEMQRIIEQMAERIAVDLERAVQKLPRQD